jgi:hypothetical protein
MTGFNMSDIAVLKTMNNAFYRTLLGSVIMDAIERVAEEAEKQATPANQAVPQTDILEWHSQTGDQTIARFRRGGEDVIRGC